MSSWNLFLPMHDFKCYLTFIDDISMGNKHLMSMKNSYCKIIDFNMSIVKGQVQLIYLPFIFLLQWTYKLALMLFIVPSFTFILVIPYTLGDVHQTTHLSTCPYCVISMWSSLCKLVFTFISFYIFKPQYKLEPLLGKYTHIQRVYT
jgi:hypothetical protein